MQIRLSLWVSFGWFQRCQVGSSGQKRTVCLLSGDIKASSSRVFLLPISVSPSDTLKTEVVARLQTWEGCSMLHLIFSHLM